MLATTVLWACACVWIAARRVEGRAAWDFDGSFEGKLLSTLRVHSPSFVAVWLILLGLAFAYGTRLDRPPSSLDWRGQSFPTAVTVSGWLAVTPLGCAALLFVAPPLWGLALLLLYGAPWLAALWLVCASASIAWSRRKGMIPTNGELFLYTTLSLFVIAAIIMVWPP